jgi:hypothetical protein
MELGVLIPNSEEKQAASAIRVQLCKENFLGTMEESENIDYTPLLKGM